MQSKPGSSRRNTSGKAIGKWSALQFLAQRRGAAEDQDSPQAIVSSKRMQG